MRLRLHLLALFLVLAFGVAACSFGRDSHGSIRIAVLLPAQGFEQPLAWALENVNRSGVAGKKLALVYVDTSKGLVDAARNVAADPSFVAAIGPESSQDVFTVADLFIAAKKPLVAPAATSAAIYRAFSSSRYVWRTVPSDVIQTKLLLEAAVAQHAKRVALITSTDLYGSTFFDWFGFYATELGLNVTALVRYDQTRGSCSAFVAKALAGDPDVLVAVPSTTRTTECVAHRAGDTPVLFADGGEDPAALGSLAGRQGIAPAAARGNGFAQAFRARFGTQPTPYAAQAYDALTLLAYGLQRSGGTDGAALADGIATVVGGRDATTGWDETGIGHALSAIRAGGRPNVTGATGPLVYARTDPASGSYAHWRVADGAFATVSVESGSGAPGASGSAAMRRAVGGTATAVGPRKSLWAVLVATSYGADNIRHQADVLAQYQVLRHNGVRDDHIILIAAGDAGNVPYFVGGPNLNRNVQIDFRLDEVTAAKFLAIVGGLHSGPNDDVYVYVVGHGGGNGVFFGVDQAVPLGGDYTVLTPAALSRTVDAMAAGKRYRRLLIAVEACQAGALGVPLTAPNALLLAAASPVESSLSRNYDPGRATWLADEFSYALWKAERASPDESLDALHEQLYLGVPGEHVSAYGPHFGDAAAVQLREFISP